MILAVVVSNTLHAQSALNRKQFAAHWTVESESPEYRVKFLGDTVDIVAPKGLTLWRKERMTGRVTIEYDAQVVVEAGSNAPTNRLSDLNCFWMATDPLHPDNLFHRAKWRNGIFTRCYSLQLYYLGFGGNHNTTTRFRRYDGENPQPAILREYTDTAHLLKANHWYHVRITNENHRIQYFIDGERLVDFRDAEPLTSGWFGFRTTLSHTRLTNFSYTEEPWQPAEVPLQWVGEIHDSQTGVSFGVPFDEGTVQPNTMLTLMADGQETPADTWPLAYWPDGSVKWMGMAAVVNKGTPCTVSVKSPKKQKHSPKKKPLASISGKQIVVNTDSLTAYIPLKGNILMDSLCTSGGKMGTRLRLVASTQSEPVSEATQQVSFENYESRIDTALIERQGEVSAVVRIDGKHASPEREWLPFCVRLYFYRGSREVKMVHSFTFDGDENSDFIRSLGVKMDVPLRDEYYNRHVAFACEADSRMPGVWSEPVQPLDGRREIYIGKRRRGRARADESLPGEHEPQLSVQQRQMAGEQLPPKDSFDLQNQEMLKQLAVWDAFRLSQRTTEGFTIRKRANDDNPWIGTFQGHRAQGSVFVGDTRGGLLAGMHDFWQSYPSGIEVNGCKTPVATLTLWLWSPDDEPMDLRHYDNVAHGLDAAYEDVQPGLSTPYGIARTTTLRLLASPGYRGKTTFARQSARLLDDLPLLPTPQYLHDREAFGVWSLPDLSHPSRQRVEKQLDTYIDYYKKQVDEHGWYGFWNYGDLMHAYDAERHEWRYDVGGFAWDNTELASNMWLWYTFLRTGRADVWRMAEAMTRHTSEVDVYHIGPNALLGSRHNVSHWGCGAKEARISQAAWNRFYYYLTTDERCGDLMRDVRDADTVLYRLDPMRLAQPRGIYPCTAPSRLRIGPDWLAYAGNWMTEWERTKDTRYRDKIEAGMRSICALSSRLFTGPLALGYDPSTGIITTECDSSLQTTNHLMTIMGGFEVMNELMRMLPLSEWQEAWLEHASLYKQKAWEIKQNRFRIGRLLAYAAWVKRDADKAREAWRDLWLATGRDGDKRHCLQTIMPPDVPKPQSEIEMISTNSVSTWSLDAIYMLETIPDFLPPGLTP